MPNLNLKALAAIGAGLIILVLLALLYMARAERDVALARADAAEAREIAFAERVKAKAEEIQRKALERARRVEAEQDRIREESTRALQVQLDDVRRRYADLLRRPSGGTGAGGGSGGGAAPAPAAGGSAGQAPQGGFSPGSPANWLTLEDALICTENSLRLVGWQEWWGAVAAVDRRPDAEPTESRPDAR